MRSLQYSVDWKELVCAASGCFGVVDIVNILAAHIRQKRGFRCCGRRPIFVAIQSASSRIVIDVVIDVAVIVNWNRYLWCVLAPLGQNLLVV